MEGVRREGVDAILRRPLAGMVDAGLGAGFVFGGMVEPWPDILQTAQRSGNGSLVPSGTGRRKNARKKPTLPSRPPPDPLLRER